jgi:hypothetical protein
MSFRELLPRMLRIQSFTEPVVKSGCIRFARMEDGKVSFNVIWDKVPAPCLHLVQTFTRRGMAPLLEILIEGYALLEGPKVISLSQLDAEAMENTRLNLSLSDYFQPFPTVFVDMPPAFFENHDVPCPQAGEKLFDHRIPSTHYPHCVGIRLYRDQFIEYIIVSVCFSSGQNLNVLIDSSHENQSLEDSINEAFDIGRVAKVQIQDITNEQECMATIAAIKVAMNTVLVVEGEGIRSLGPDNLKHYQKLQDNVKKGHRRGDPEEKQQKAELLLRAEPLYYTFDQKVVLYHREDDVREPGEVTGRHVRPHWRSGYHRMQRFGPGNLQRKRIRIPPVMVNRNRFLGKNSDTLATYHALPK